MAASRSRGLRLIACVMCTVVCLPVRAWAKESLDERRERVARMSPAELEQLRRKQERFAALNESERQRLRDMHDQLAAAPDAAELHQVMLNYEAWLSSRTAIERAELAELGMPQRVERIRQVVAFERSRQARRLSPEDVAVLAEWLERKVVEGQPEDRRVDLSRLPASERRRQITRMVFERWQGGDVGRWIPLARENDLAELKLKLSEAALAQLEQAQTPQQRQELFGEWMRQLAFQYFSGRDGRNEVDDDRLKRFFLHEMPEHQRAELLALPPDEFQQRLRQYYFWQRGHRGDGRPGPPVRGDGIPGGPMRGDGNPGERPGFRPGENRPGENRPNENRPEGFRPLGEPRPGENRIPPGNQPRVPPPT